MMAEWYCVSCVDSPSSNSRDSCLPAPFCFFGLGIGVMKSAGRRLSSMRCVGWPVASSSQCRAGSAYGELRTGRRKKSSLIVVLAVLGCSPLDRPSLHPHGDEQPSHRTHHMANNGSLSR